MDPGGLDDAALAERFEALRREYFPEARLQFRVAWSNRMRIAGMCYPGLKVIRLSRSYHAHFPGEIDLTLRHELIHAAGIAGHGKAFRREAARLGCPVHGRTYPGLHRPHRYEYVCPNGHVHRARRRLGNCSCGRCSRRFDPRYRLQLVRDFAIEQTRG